jgi:hypothetical protein
VQHKINRDVVEGVGWEYHIYRELFWEAIPKPHLRVRLVAYR